MVWLEGLSDGATRPTGSPTAPQQRVGERSALGQSLAHISEGSQTVSVQVGPPPVDPSDPATWPDPDEEELTPLTERDRANADAVGNGLPLPDEEED